MTYDFDKLASTYNYNTYCVCGGYWEYDSARPIMSTNPPLYPVKCRICLKENYTSPKGEKNENETATQQNVHNNLPKG